MFNEMLYRGYRNKKFADVFEEAEDFAQFYETCGIPAKLSNEDSIITIYYLLMARYANSTIASSDENRFKYAVMSLIFSYGPSWEKRIEIQDTLRGLTVDELMAGSKAIYNKGYNPSTPVPQDGEIATINEQNTSTFKRSKLDAYGNLLALIQTDVTGDFLSKFQKLFIAFPPEMAMYYATEEEEEDDTGND